MAASKKDSIPRDFRTIDAAAAFWDRHSLADYAEHLKPAKIRFQLRGRVHLLAVDPDIAAQLRAASRARGLSPRNRRQPLAARTPGARAQAPARVPPCRVAEQSGLARMMIGLLAGNKP
jgi:hypothetical protein